MYDIGKQKKVVKARCSCPIDTVKCGLFSDEERRKIFLKFWKRYKTWPEKGVLIESLVDKVGTKDHRHRQIAAKSRRSGTFLYHLKLNNVRTPVCKKMFLNTLAISDKKARSAINQFSSDITDDSDLDIPERKKTIPVKVTQIRSSAKNFFDKLAKMESHFCRKYTSKIYLEPSWRSVGELFLEYEQDCAKNSIPSCKITLFRKIFKEMNLSLFLPKKDQCDVCTAFNAGNVSVEEYQQHRSNKELAQKEKERDTKTEKNVFTMDMQSVLLSPYLKASAIYYKTKLANHDFTLFDNKTKDGYCYFWHEGEGGLTANEFATIVCKFIDSLTTEPGETLIFYSDGCTYQNRNVTMANALSNMAMNKNVIIIQKILEKGHTQMQCDSMHSTIERRVRNKNIYCPKNYVLAALKARKKPRAYVVNYLDHSYFKNFDSLNFYSSIRPGRNKVGEPVVTDLRCIKYLPNGKIEYKLSYSSDNWKVLPQTRNNIPNIPLDKLPQLYDAPIKITGQKYKHLQELKTVIPAKYHAFYDNLEHLEIEKKTKKVDPGEPESSNTVTPKRKITKTINAQGIKIRPSSKLTVKPKTTKKTNPVDAHTKSMKSGPSSKIIKPKITKKTNSRKSRQSTRF